METVLYIVIPCYNEEEAVPKTAAAVSERLRGLIGCGKISPLSRVLFVDDGSEDSTWSRIEALHRQSEVFSGVKLSRNRGHQNALLAGLMTAREKADAVISIDADLQDDTEVIDLMTERFLDGCDVVYGVRSSRDRDGFFKRFTAEGYYRMLRSMGADIVFNHADCRLLSKRALEGLSEFHEVNLFLRGIVPMLGFKTGTVFYDRAERVAGRSKYSLKKMMSLATDGITSLSTRPLGLITGAGVFFLAVTAVLFVFMLIRNFCGYPILGWRIVLLAILLMGSLILIAVGTLGAYVGRTYLETKRRPRYLIEKILDR